MVSNVNIPINVDIASCSIALNYNSLLTSGNSVPQVFNVQYHMGWLLDVCNTETNIYINTMFYVKLHYKSRYRKNKFCYLYRRVTALGKDG